MDIVTFVAGAAAGGLVLWLILRRSNVEKARIQERNLFLEQQLRQSKEELTGARGTIVDLTSSLSASRSDVAHLQEQLQTERKQLQEMQRTLTDQFKGIATTCCSKVPVASGAI
jgi:uncharacterized protein HemX